MRKSDGVRALALTTPVVSNHSFLNQSYELTVDMVDWYYRTPTTQDIFMRDIDDCSSVVEIVENINNKIIIRSFTIGRKTKQLIYNNYMFYHSMESNHCHKPII